MTTNIYDANSKKVATDSRWSVTVKNTNDDIYAIIYSDDVLFEKIDSNSEFVFMFAGRMKEIAQWKQIIENGIENGEIPESHYISMCIINKDNARVEYAINQGYVSEHSTFMSGTGGKHAYKSWLTVKDVDEAVKEAIKLDNYSGGNVKNYCIERDVHNLVGNNMSYDEAIIKFKETAMVKYIQNNSQEDKSIQDCMIDPLINEAITGVSNGSISVSAPFGYGNKLDEFDRENLKNFFALHYKK